MATLSPFVQRMATFQYQPLLNRGVLEVTGVDVPYIALAKNNTERQERIFRQAFIILFALLLAPIHSRLFARLGISKWLKPKQIGVDLQKIGVDAEELLRISSKALKETEPAKLKASLEKFFDDTLNKPLPEELKSQINDTFRKHLIKAKYRFLSNDMLLEGAIFGSLGWLRTLFAKYVLTGNKQFTGELGIVSNEKLDKLYKKEKSKQMPALYRNIFSTAAGALGPYALGKLLEHALLHPEKTGKLYETLRKLAPRFDYKYLKGALRKWPLFSMAYIVVISLANDLGEVLSARSVREFRELLLVRSAIDGTFFLGDSLWMLLLSPFFLKKDGLKLTTSIEKAIQQAKTHAAQKHFSPEATQNFVNQTAGRSARLFLTSFLLNMFTVGAAILGANHLTRNSVKEEAAKLDTPQYLPPSFHHKQFSQYLALNRGTA